MGKRHSSEVVPSLLGVRWGLRAVGIERSKRVLGSKRALPEITQRHSPSDLWEAEAAGRKASESHQRDETIFAERRQVFT